MTAAARALDDAGLDAPGVIAVVDAGMERALRAVSVERGVDPAGLALVAFGGAGPLHACALADALGVAAVIVPAAAGVLSAVGLLTSPRRRELVASWPRPSDHDGLDAALDDLAARAARLLTGGDGDRGDGRMSPPTGPAGEVRTTTAVDCRYRGQSHELRVPTVEDFPAAHRRRNGYDRPGDPIEVTAIRAVAEAPAPSTIEDVLGPWAGRWERRSEGPVRGPQVVVREDCTIWVPEGWSGEPGALGALVLRREGVGS